MSDKTFVSEIKRLQSQKPIEGFDYYEITLIGREGDTIKRSITTQFAGYTDSKPMREIRKASFVYPDKMLAALREIGEPGLLVNNEADLLVFLLFGGHGVIEKSVAQKFFRDLMGPHETAQSTLGGHLIVSSLPKQQLQHAPTKKLRMKIIKRDRYRCRACGRSPSENVDIELEVHHIRPWGEGGLTEEENLITLCATCHNGLHPHFEPDLFNLIDIDPIRDGLRRDRAEYIEGLRNYQRIAFQNWRKVGAKSKRTAS